MKIIKLIFLALPLALTYLLLFTNPAQAASLKLTYDARQQITLVSNPGIVDGIIPSFSHKSHPLLDGVGCNCSNCVQAQLQMQGKLPLASLL
ncbi:MAG: hypothetical protein QNJ63_26125 [Calothrix sp. MO_192.B10]|nr:hypothetical protein [Calothrix sp. MO_192.B10]